MQSNSTVQLCAKNANCKSNNCKGGHCRDPGAYEFCSVSSQNCPVNLYCNDKSLTCVPNEWTMQTPCRNQADCFMNDYCTSGVCVSRGFEGTNCSFSHECRDGLGCFDRVCRNVCHHSMPFFSCAENYYCSSGFCLPASTIPKSRIQHTNPNQLLIAILILGSLVLVFLIFLKILVGQWLAKLRNRRDQNNFNLYQYSMRETLPQGPPPPYTSIYPSSPSTPTQSSSESQIINVIPLQQQQQRNL